MTIIQFIKDAGIKFDMTLASTAGGSGAWAFLSSTELGQFAATLACLSAFALAAIRIALLMLGKPED